MSKRVSRRAAAVLGLLVMLSLMLCLFLNACNREPTEAAKNNRALAIAFLDLAKAGDKDAAYAMVESVCTPTEFLTVWEPMLAALEGAEGYELYNRSHYSGDGVTTISYFGEADNGSVFYLRISTQEGRSGIAGMGFNDVTVFNEKTAYVEPLNMVLFGITLALWAFEIWMLVDCARRKLPRKGLWIILILLSLGLTCTIGAEEFSLRLAGNLFALCGIERELASSTLSIQAILPFGALTYLLLRRRLCAEAEASEPPTA